jgi:5-formyltetrahydrofolate cyclo-ligase
MAQEMTATPEIEVETTAAKTAMRARAKARRGRIAAGTRRRAPDRVAKNLLRDIALPSGSVISAYWPLPDELDTGPLLAMLAAAGHQVALPVVVASGAPLQFRRWRPGMQLCRGGFGVLVPPDDAEVVEPRIVLAPLLAFDDHGYRLGYGGGYYDRTLRARRAGQELFLAIGLAFAEQEVAEVPHGPNDERLDWLVTERDVRKMGAVA